VTQSLISTKFVIPAWRPVLVARQRLVERLNAGTQGKLSLVSAPAGFGKTTLVVAWLRSVNQAVSWLSLDEADNDPARFLTYFLAALQVIDPSVGKDTVALLQEPQPPPPDLLATTLLNELTAISRPFILAIDDFHTIQTLSIQQLLNFIVDHQPGQMHLVLMTREDPPLPLARLRARGEMTEIRQDDLRFTLQECAEFLETVMGLKLSKSDLSALERRTEGWVTGLQLAAISMQGRDDLPRFVQEFTGSNRYVLDYLVQEVFEGLSGEIQDFLLETSILERLCGSLCDAVTERSGSQVTLEILEQANLFITPLDQSRTWYRYHRLFRDLLRNRLELQGDLVLKSLHQRASVWHETHDQLPEAIQHALSGKDWDKALKLIHNANLPFMNRGEIFTLMSWYGKLPEDLILGDREACADYAWPLMLSGQFEQAGSYLTHAEGNTSNEPALMGKIYTAQAYLARAQGDNRRMVALSQLARSFLPEDDQHSRSLVSMILGIAYWHSGKMEAAEQALVETIAAGEATGNLYAVSTAQVFQGMVMAVRGKLREASNCFGSILQQGGIPAFVRGLAYLYLSVIHYEWDELENSGNYLLKVIDIGERIRNDELLIFSWMVMARIHMASGNLPAAVEVLENAHKKVNSGNPPAHALPRMAAAQVQLAIVMDDLDSAARWSEHLVEDCDCPTFYRFTNTTRALLLLAQNNPEAAAQHLAGCFEQASREGWVYGMIAIRVLQALAAPTPEAAYVYLTDGLELGFPEGFIRTFIDLGKELEPLLQTAKRRGVVPEYTGKILAAMAEKAKPSVLGQLALVEPLSQRELEVLHLMAAGSTNRQIAEKLVISTGTAKVHVHNVCGKLGCRNRTEAATRAHELGLV
jgi:LuxR family maltose regulon positive regulatory protein